MIEEDLVAHAISPPHTHTNPPNNSTSLSLFLLRVKLIIFMWLYFLLYLLYKDPLTFHCRSLGISFSTPAALTLHLSLSATLFPCWHPKLNCVGVGNTDLF